MEQINRVIDLSPGCGGLTQGFVDAGFIIEPAIENDAGVAASTHRSSFGERILSADVGTIPEEFLPDADVVIGTLSCGLLQPGNSDSAEARRLRNAFIRIVDLVSPQVFVFAGASELLNPNELTDLVDRTERQGELEGYRLAWGFLNSGTSDLVPSQRWAVIVGTWTGVPSLPAAFEDGSLVVDLRGPDSVIRHGSADGVARHIEHGFPPQLATIVARHVRDVVLESHRVPNTSARVPTSSALTA